VNVTSLQLARGYNIVLNLVYARIRIPRASEERARGETRSLAAPLDRTSVFSQVLNLASSVRILNLVYAVDIARFLEGFLLFIYGFPYVSTIPT
jgi:hypothetical protein